MKKITFKIAILVAVFVVVSVAHAQTGGSWSNPTATPPGNNVSAPLHVGSAAQEKQGTLGVRGTTGAFRIFDRETPTDSWAWYAARDNASTNSWLRLWNYQDLRDQLSVDRTGMRLFGNLWSGGVVSGTLQVTGGSPKTGMVLKSTDDFGTAAWSDNSEGATILVADLVIPNLTSIGSTGTNVTPFTVSVTGARVGDLASVAYPAGYSYDQMTQVCGATTATVSAPNTVKVQFWNSYGSASCIIPNGTYKINVIQKGGGPVNTVVSGEASLTTNGYQVFSSGLILQWGVISTNSTYNNLPKVQNFPKVFPNAAFSVTVTAGRKGNGAGDKQSQWGGRVISKSQFEYYAQYENPDAGPFELYWMAVGW